MIEGLRKPDSGTVTIDGQDPWKRDPECSGASACSCSRRRSSGG
jgi:ABC-type uncharacterized transport system ATPase subunit